jgi:putative hydrolase of the HAD superfamily
MIKNLIFDLGGVIITLAPEEALRRFKSLGLENAEEQMDIYTQTGIFGQLEEGKISAETFREELSRQVGREVTYDECRHAWLGYVKEVPQRNLDVLQRLRSEGYRLILLSNTNPFMMSWVRSPEFDGHGHSIDYYMDACYLSYQLGVMKPSTQFFHEVLMTEKIMASESLFLDDGARNVATASQMGMRTYCPENGADWTSKIYEYLK